MTQLHTSYIEHLLLPALIADNVSVHTHTIALSPSLTYRLAIDGDVITLDTYEYQWYRSISGTVFKVLRELGCSVHGNLTSSMLLYRALIVENSASETIHIGPEYARQLLTTISAAKSYGTYEVSPDFGSITYGESGVLITPFGLNDEDGWFTSHSDELVQHLTTFTLMV